MRMYLLGSTLAVPLGFVLDLLFGDPFGRFHPICLVGNTIAALEKRLRRLFYQTDTATLVGGALLVCLTLAIWTLVPLVLLLCAYRLGFFPGLFWKP